MPNTNLSDGARRIQELINANAARKKAAAAAGNGASSPSQAQHPVNTLPAVAPARQMPTTRDIADLAQRNKLHAQVASHAGGVAVNALQVPLTDVQIDPDQPRQYLPPEIRKKVVSGGLTPAGAIEELTRRAGKDDVCRLYLADITEEARSISAQGQLVAAIVTKAPSNVPVKYRLIDGERRFWALTWLVIQEPAKKRTLRAELAPDTLSAEQILQMQIATNLERNALSTMDIVDLVRRQKDIWDSRLATNREHFAAQISASPEEIANRGLAICATAQDMTKMLGRPVSGATVYRYLQVSEKLNSDAKRLARIHDVGVKALVQISSWDAGKQLEELAKRQIAAPVEVDQVPATKPASPPEVASKSGRPSKAAWAKGTIERFTLQVAKLDAKAIRKLSKRDAEQILGALDEAEEIGARLRKLLQGHTSGKAL